MPQRIYKTAREYWLVLAETGFQRWGIVRKIGFDQWKALLKGNQAFTRTQQGNITDPAYKAKFIAENNAWFPSEIQYDEIWAETEHLYPTDTNGGVPKKDDGFSLRGLASNDVSLAFTPTCHVGRTYFYNASGVNWPDVGDRTNPATVSVPTNLWKRTIWCHVSALGGAWYWQGQLVGRLSGQSMFSMSVRFAGAAGSPNLKLFPSAQTAGASPCQDAFQFNDVSGVPMSPFTFICSCDEVNLEVTSSAVGTSDTRLFLMVRSAATW